MSGLPWGSDIKKLECANHVEKCFRTHMEKLVTEKPTYKGREKLTEKMRKRLTKSARSTILMQSQEEDQQQAIHKLQEDLMNLPLHCFGYHANCSPDFCKTAQQCNMGNATPAIYKQHNSGTVAAPADESNLTSALDDHDTNNSGKQLL